MANIDDKQAYRIDTTGEMITETFLRRRGLLEKLKNAGMQPKEKKERIDEINGTTSLATQQYKLRKLKRDFLSTDPKHLSGSSSRQNLSSEQPSARAKPTSLKSESNFPGVKTPTRDTSDAYRIKHDNIKKASQTIDGWLNSSSNNIKNAGVTLPSWASKNE
jgi:hypothetical protein